MKAKRKPRKQLIDKKAVVTDLLPNVGDMINKLTSITSATYSTRVLVDLDIHLAVTCLRSAYSHLLTSITHD